MPLLPLFKYGNSSCLLSPRSARSPGKPRRCRPVPTSSRGPMHSGWPRLSSRCLASPKWMLFCYMSCSTGMDGVGCTRRPPISRGPSVGLRLLAALPLRKEPHWEPFSLGSSACVMFGHSRSITCLSLRSTGRIGCLIPQCTGLVTAPYSPTAVGSVLGVSLTASFDSTAFCTNLCLVPPPFVHDVPAVSHDLCTR